MTETSYAHSKKGVPRSEWHTLRAHLEAVARLASAFASKWDAGDWGYYAGLWHDLGKFCEDFQKMITADSEAERSQVNHSSAGALRAMEELGEIGLLLAFVIAGHHAGCLHLRGRLHSSEPRCRDAAVAGGAEYDPTGRARRILHASPRLRGDAFQVVCRPREDKVSIHFRKGKKNLKRILTKRHSRHKFVRLHSLSSQGTECQCPQTDI